MAAAAIQLSSRLQLQLSDLCITLNIMHATHTASLLTINSGSSSLKFALYAITGIRSLQRLYRGQLTAIGGSSQFQISDADGNLLQKQNRAIPDHKQALQLLLDWLSKEHHALHLVATGHRVVHGGSRFHAPTLVTPDVFEYLQRLIPLAPNHQPPSLLGISTLQRLQPDLPQIACFDTAFHHHRPEVEQRFALPSHPDLQAVRRYGFHGLSYQYIARVLPDYLGAAADEKIIVAHLGHGASLCAMHERRSVATTMTFTPLDGIPMGTRCGAIDPAVVLYLQQQGMTPEAISELLYFKSGLLGLSGVSDNLAELLKHPGSQPRFAIDLFVHHTVRAIGSLAAALGGVDALVFTAGIGEHAAPVRAAICKGCEWLGLEPDEQANRLGKPCITLDSSPLQAWVIATDEERMIAEQTFTAMEHTLPN